MRPIVVRCCNPARSAPAAAAEQPPPRGTPHRSASMFIARQSEVGAETGKWFTVVIERRAMRRIGYCAVGCGGHTSADEALAHHLQYQLDRETDLWLDRRSMGGLCEMCDAYTTLHA